MDIAPTAYLYARPAGFIDAPFGFDGQFARLAGGLQFFSAWEIIARDGTRETGAKRSGSWFVPIDRIDTALASVSDAQRMRLQMQIAAATAPRPAWTLGDRTIRLDQPQVMGILNMTPDSGAGKAANLDDVSGAAEQAIAMSAAGAAIIDIGGESTRPNANVIWEQDEIARVIPVIEALRHSGTAMSIDTRKASVMTAALKAGAHIINDVSALLYDERSLDVVRGSNGPIILMHFGGTAQDPHGNDTYGDPLLDIYDWLEARITAVEAAGVDRKRIAIDPGIGFGKNVAANLAIINGLALLHTLGCPILFGASRKRMIGALANEATVEARLPGSLALALKAAEQGAQIIRVHDVTETVQAIKIWRGMRDAALSPL